MLTTHAGFAESGWLMIRGPLIFASRYTGRSLP